MKKVVTSVMLSLCSANSFADRYGVYDDPEYHSGGGSGIFSVLGAIASSILAFWFLSSSYKEWKHRKLNGEKIERSDFVADIVAPCFGYILAAFFLSFPLVMLSKFIGIAGSLMDTWLTIGALCFGVVAFLRQT
ncbi:hypothetical protein L4C39_19815 [Vibrio clamense]|uniref:putative four-helix membrane protein n=1 Tax=Vibrio clamense TaxID=2910254 RepID=UPI003D255A90